jgi:glutaredoxin
VTALTLLGKPDCGLCREMREIVDRVAADFALTVVERDIRNDPEDEKRYVLEIPVLFLGDERIARYRITEEALRERLARAAPPTP